MAFFNEFPFTRNYDSDLGWLIRNVKKLMQKFERCPTWYGQWVAEIEYPALSFVQYGTDGDVYMSLRPVPANTPITDTRYWQLTGSTSEQILELQRRMTAAESDISSLDDRVDALENPARKIICIGDSYLALDQDTASYGAFLKIYFGSATDIKLYGQGGAGFLQGTASRIFQDLIEEAYTAESDPGSVTDIVVLGGMNDAARFRDVSTTTEAMLRNQISAFILYCNQNFPKAKITVGFLGWTAFGNVDRATLNPFFLPVIDIYRRIGFIDRTGKARYMTGSEYLMAGMATSRYNSNDKIHPTAATSSTIASAIYNFLQGGGTTPTDIQAPTALSLIAAGVCTAISDNTLNYYVDGDKIMLCGGSCAFKFASGTGFNSLTHHVIATIPESPIRGGTAGNMRVPCRIGIFPGASGAYDVVEGDLIFNNGTLSIQGTWDAANRYANVTNISVWIGATTLDTLIAA